MEEEVGAEETGEGVETGVEGGGGGSTVGVFFLVSRSSMLTRPTNKRSFATGGVVVVFVVVDEVGFGVSVVVFGGLIFEEFVEALNVLEEEVVVFEGAAVEEVEGLSGIMGVVVFGFVFTGVGGVEFDGGEDEAGIIIGEEEKGEGREGEEGVAAPLASLSSM